MIKIDIVKIEACDETNEPVYTLECFDSACATLTISTLVCRESWPELAESIASALNMIFPEAE